MKQQSDLEQYFSARKAVFEKFLTGHSNKSEMSQDDPFKPAYDKVKDVLYSRVKQAKGEDKANKRMKLITLGEQNNSSPLHMLVVMTGFCFEYYIDEKEVLPLIQWYLKLGTDDKCFDLKNSCGVAYSCGLVKTVKVMVEKEPYLKQHFNKFLPCIWKRMGPDVVRRHSKMLKLEKEMQLLTPDRIEQLQDEWQEVGIDVHDLIK